MGWFRTIFGRRDHKERPADRDSAPADGPETAADGRVGDPPRGPVELDLPAPDQLRPRWAAVAAVLGSVGYGSEDCRSDDGDWYYHDGGGNWCRLYRYADGRALLVGSDHEYSDTFYGEAAAYFERPETDLLAAGEPWWGDALGWHDRRDGQWVSFIYAFDGQRWRRAPYDLDDGFASLDLPAVSDERARRTITEYAKGEGDDDLVPDLGARVEEVLRAGVDVTADQVRALGSHLTEPGVGVAAARGFAAPGRH